VLCVLTIALLTGTERGQKRAYAVAHVLLVCRDMMLTGPGSHLANVDLTLVVLDADDLRLEEAVAIEVLVLGVLRGQNAGLGEGQTLTREKRGQRAGYAARHGSSQRQRRRLACMGPEECLRHILVERPSRRHRQRHPAARQLRVRGVARQVDGSRTHRRFIAGISIREAEPCRTQEFEARSCRGDLSMHSTFRLEKYLAVPLAAP